MVMCEQSAGQQLGYHCLTKYYTTCSQDSQVQSILVEAPITQKFYHLRYKVEYDFLQKIGLFKEIVTNTLSNVELIQKRTNTGENNTIENQTDEQ